jgi:hypothetical protein
MDQESLRPPDARSGTGVYCVTASEPFGQVQAAAKRVRHGPRDGPVADGSRKSRQLVIAARRCERLPRHPLRPVPRPALPPGLSRSWLSPRKSLCYLNAARLPALLARPPLGAPAILPARAFAVRKRIEGADGAADHREVPGEQNRRAAHVVSHCSSHVHSCSRRAMDERLAAAD